ncbi:MAG: poly-beta-1,6-N-acetyl-D-glucosamine biosynthesis protein PgaD [Rhodospirillaceae bacterium]|nr:poly-beta-1,6-N-acetyl-D-glucosamine biosynthesis protein PgaD [Rhodospirillales bacterium]
MNTLIIHAHQCRSPSQRGLDMVMTALMWAVYLYLAREALLFVAMLAEWLVNPEGAWLLHRFAAILPTLVLYAQIAVVNALVLFAWAYANQLRFQSRERRHGLTQVDAPELARFHHVPEHDIAQWLEARRLVIHHDENGNLTHVETGVSGPRDFASVA